MHDNESKEFENASTESHSTERVDEGRREALKKMGKYGLYVAPAVVAVLLAEKGYTLPPPPPSPPPSPGG